MKKIAITGGIGSGKSTVSRYLFKKGYPVFSCDEISKRIWETEEYQNIISSAFPLAVVDGILNRKVLSKIVFEDKSAIAPLNEISHPYILKILMEEMNKAKSELVFAEVPLLFEGEYVDMFDGAIVVLREKTERIAAVMARDGLSQEEVLRRMDNQFDYDKNISRLKEEFYCVENKGSEDALYQNVDEILKQLS